MAKSIEIWVARGLNGAKSGAVVKKRTIKALADELGMSYSTAKAKKKETKGQVMLWMIGEFVWEVKSEKID